MVKLLNVRLTRATGRARGRPLTLWRLGTFFLGPLYRKFRIQDWSSGFRIRHLNHDHVDADNPTNKNDKDSNDDMGISALGLDRDLGFSRVPSYETPMT